MKLSELIKDLRWKHSFTQQELANYLDLSQETISAWERGTKKLSTNTAKKLVKFCRKIGIEVNLEDLI